MSWAFLISAALLAFHTSAALLAFRAIRTARTPQGAVGWTVFLLALPYLGVPAYLILGDFNYPGMIEARRLSEQVPSPPATGTAAQMPAESARMRHGYEAIAGRATVAGNAVGLLTAGEEVFETLFAAIRAAERYVLVETYILRDDGLGRALQELLIAKARAGLRVCVLYDPFGSYGLDRAYVAQMRAAGVEVMNFHARHPPRRLAPLRLNFRNHRKIAVIDGKTGFTGGYNIGDEYVGRNPRLGDWRDTMLRLEGPVVAQLQLHFAADWHWATGERLDLDWAPAPVAGGLPALVLASGPSDRNEPGTLYFQHAITGATKRIWIASPYFAPDTGLMRALGLAALRGVDVRVIMAGKRDHWLVWLAAFAFLDAMRESGVKFYRFGPGFMHQKVVLIDDMIAGVGSHNLDSRSCRLNFEASALVFDRGFAGEVTAMLERDFARAEPWDRPLAQAPLALRIAAPVARLFAPIL
ncbi:MAG: cardiolipin synthase [Paenirhodobacter sp.]|uniref:cardiolipin synthase n=1 Tax=Paenirhodobacter sp. TaxID=1965326 RepID=UPI003D13A939